MQLKLDTGKLTELFRSFHQIVGVRIGVFDWDAKCLHVYPKEECRFCRTLKQEQTFCSRCIETDREAVQQAMQGNTQVYRCHAGLYEAVTPILCDNAPIACLMIGQVAPEQAEPMDQAVQQYLQGHSEYAQLMHTFQAMPRRSEQELAACAQIMAACAGYIYLNAMIAPRYANLSARLQEYFGLHYAEPLPLVAVADALQVSVSYLCATVRRECNTTPHRMLTEIRMTKAMELLQQTALPVSEVASRVGIFDYNYFARVFHSKTGMSPSAYRKNNRAG